MEKKKVFLVEDNADIREAVKTVLENALGYEVITARDGVDAMNILEKQHPDISAAILDIMMKSHGGTVRDYLKKHPEYKEIPIIYHTGLDREQVDERVLQGAHFIHKDGDSLFKIKELLSKLME